MVFGRVSTASAAPPLTRVLLAAACVLRTLEVCARASALLFAARLPCLAASVLQTLARFLARSPGSRPGISSTQTGVLAPALPAFTADESATARGLAPKERNANTKIKRGVVERRVELLESGFLDRNDGGVGDERRLHLVRCGSFGGVDRFHGAHADEECRPHRRRERHGDG